MAGCKPVSVDLRVSRIYHHLEASPSFGGQIAGAGAGGTPRLTYLLFQTMEMPLDGDNTQNSAQSLAFAQIKTNNPKKEEISATI